MQSVDAWTLGAGQALAEELGVQAETLRLHYPSKNVEDISNQSGNVEHRPKVILQRIAEAHGRRDGVAFRIAVAERMDVEELAKACPRGFEPFVREVRQAFGACAE